MKYTILILFIFKISFSQPLKDTLLLKSYFTTIYQAEDNFLRKNYDSSYTYYVKAFKLMQSVNPKMNGFRYDINNFIELQTYLKNPKNEDDIKNYNTSKAVYKLKLEATLDSLIRVDQDIRQLRIPYKKNDSAETIIKQVDYKNFNFLLPILDTNFPTEFEISEKSYVNLELLLLHAAHIKVCKPLVKNLLIKYQGIIYPRRYINTLSLSLNQFLGSDYGLLQLGLYHRKTAKTIIDPKIYTAKLILKEIREVNVLRQSFYLPSIEHHLKCCCFRLHHKDSKMNFLTILDIFNFSDEKEYLSMKKKLALFKCN